MGCRDRRTGILLEILPEILILPESIPWPIAVYKN